MARKGMIFKEVEEGLHDLKKRYKYSKENGLEDLEEIKQRLKIMLDISKYLDSCDWLKKEEAKVKLTKIRASKYNYKAIREELSLTDDAVKSFMRYCISKAKESIGESTVHLIREGNYKIGAVQFYTLSGTYKLEDLVMKEVYEGLPKSKFDPFTLIDCLDEIKFIKDYSKEEYTNRLSKLDKGKLEFIRYIIEKDTPKYSEDKYNMLGLIMGKITYEEYIEKLEETSNFRPTL